MAQRRDQRKAVLQRRRFHGRLRCETCEVAEGRRPIAVRQSGRRGVEDAEVLDRWPKIDPAAFHGAAGEIVRLADPHTEADPVATLVQVLAAFGNMIGRNCFFSVGATRHYLNLFIALVGLTALGRKGTSWDVARWTMAAIDPEWSEHCIASGMSSGEGLIYHVRDPQWQEKSAKDPKTKAVTKELVCTDPGVTEKRLLVVETEMGRVLKVMNRDANTLSDVLRQAWDTGDLRNLSKQAHNRATGAHITVIAHVTQPDVRRHLTETDSANGFAGESVHLWPLVATFREPPGRREISRPKKSGCRSRRLSCHCRSPSQGPAELRLDDDRREPVLANGKADHQNPERPKRCGTRSMTNCHPPSPVWSARFSVGPRRR